MPLISFSWPQLVRPFQPYAQIKFLLLSGILRTSLRFNTGPTEWPPANEYLHFGYDNQAEFSRVACGLASAGLIVLAP
jgi:hypothetical protein